jgi:hypothetical protein
VSTSDEVTPSFDVQLGATPASESPEEAERQSKVADKTWEQLSLTVWREVLEGFKSAYDDSRDNWKTLDTKAQGVVAIAGIFIAGIVSLLKDLPPGEMELPHLLLAFASIDSVGAVLCAAAALRIRPSTLPPAGKGTRDLAVGLLSPDHVPLLAELEMRFVQEQSDGWETSVKSVQGGNDKKANLLAGSQILLLGVVVPVLIVLLDKLLIHT